MNNKSIALNILQSNNEQKISHLYKSEHNKTREDRVIFVKRLNALLKKRKGHSG